MTKRLKGVGEALQLHGDALLPAAVHPHHQAAHHVATHFRLEVNAHVVVPLALDLHRLHRRPKRLPRRIPTHLKLNTISHMEFI
jgi:hypothetical protein